MSVEQVRIDKKLIFTVTPGRSGTSYLAQLLASVPDVGAYHEPSPNFAQVLRLSQSMPNVAYNYLTQYKIPAIQADPHGVYAETSHMTCKGFLEPLIRMGLRPGLVILRRHPREVAWSFQERGCVPTRSTYGIRDLLDPRDLGVTPFLNWEMASNYQLCYWYAIEMERRQLFYTQMAKDLGLPWIDLTNRELNQWERYADLLRTFQLPITPDVQAAHAAISAQRHNQNDTYSDLSASVSSDEEAVWNVVEHFQPTLRDAIRKRYGQG